MVTVGAVVVGAIGVVVAVTAGEPEPVRTMADGDTTELLAIEMDAVWLPIVRGVKRAVNVQVLVDAIGAEVQFPL